MNCPPLARSSAANRIEQILDPSKPLCKEDVVWVLDYITKKVAEEDPVLLDLSQPRLLKKNFHYFAEIARLLIHQSGGVAADPQSLKRWIAEASFGLNSASLKET